MRVIATGTARPPRPFAVRFAQKARSIDPTPVPYAAAVRGLWRSRAVLRAIIGAVAAATLGMLVAPVAQAAAVAAPSPWAVSEAAGHGAIAGYLDGVVCAAAAHCVAVGSQVDTKGNAHALVETLNGAAWGHQVLALPAGRAQAFLFGVACPTTTWCAAVGYDYGSRTVFPLVETMTNGVWSVAPAPPEPAHTNVGLLDGVACTGPRNCVAVGLALNRATKRDYPWVARMAASKWSSSVPTALSNVVGGLNGVSCTSAVDCVAVGRTTTKSNTTVLATLRAGTWALVPLTVKLKDVYAPGLNSVACGAGGHCVAVGEVGSKSPPLVLAGSGTAGPVPGAAPPAGEGATGLWGASCPAVGGCVAVGALAPANPQNTFSGSLPNPQGVLIQRASGAGWAAESPPKGLPADSGLSAVACVAQFCVAVGMTGRAPQPGTVSARTLIIET